MKAEGTLLGPNGLDRVRNPTTGEWLLMPRMPEHPRQRDAPSAGGIIDSGVLADHPQIAPFLAGERSFTNEPVQDMSGHGSLVFLQYVRGAFEAQARLDGDADQDTAPLRLFSAKVTRSVNGAAIPEIDAVIAAIDWLEEKEVLLVNMSLGFTDLTPPEKRAALCERMAAAPMIFNVAASNDPVFDVWPAACRGVENMRVLGEQAQSGPVESASEVERHVPSGLATVSRAQFLAHKADEALRRGNLAEAEAALADALSEGETATAHEVAYQLHAEAGDWENALDSARRSAALAPDSARAPIFVATALTELYRNDEVLETLDSARAVGSDQFAAWHWLQFVVVFRQNRQAEAEVALREVARIDPNFPMLQSGIHAFTDWYGTPPVIDHAQGE